MMLLAKPCFGKVSPIWESEWNQKIQEQSVKTNRKISQNKQHTNFQKPRQQAH